MGILGKKRLEFKDNAELERYYEAKYARGGYEGDGCTIRGVDISRHYHQARHASAFRLLNPQPQDVILDAGCGDGALAARIAPRCRRVCAVDIAGNAMGLAIREVPNLEFRKMNLESLDFPDAHFDRIVCVEALEHLLHPDAALAEFWRILKPGGRLVVTYPTVNRTRVRDLQARIGIVARLDISEHLTEWSLDELAAHARHAGFDLIESEGIVFDFGVLTRLKHTARFLADGMTRLALAIRRFPRNSSFVSVGFRRSDSSVGSLGRVLYNSDGSKLQPR